MQYWSVTSPKNQLENLKNYGKLVDSGSYLTSVIIKIISIVLYWFKMYR